MNILMINLPYSGHTNPTLGLARELVNRGHKVTYINSENWRDRIEATGAEFIPYDSYPRRPTVNQEKRLCIKAAYETGLRIGADQDLLIYELLFYPGKRLAGALGIPCVRQFSMFAWNKNVLNDFISNTALWKLFRFRSVRRKMTKVTCPQSGCTDMLEEIVDNTPDLNIVYTTRQFQLYSREFDERFQFVGPSIYKRLSDTAISWDKIHNPIIYISLGTVLNFNPAFYRKCIKAFACTDHNIIISAGKLAKKLNKANRAGNIMIYESVPQLEILEHAALFITHGGMNSVNEAIYYGVPMLVAPIGSDQPTVARRVEELGIGKMISCFNTGYKEIYTKALEVLNDDKITDSVRLQSRYARQAGGLAKAVDIIENYTYENQ